MAVQAVMRKTLKRAALAVESKHPTTAIAVAWFAPLLQSIERGKSELVLRKGACVYSQGQKADSMYFSARGKVRLSVVSTGGKGTILGVLDAGGCCGEGCLAGQPLRVGSATALSPVAAIRVQKEALVQALHDYHPLSEAFLAQPLMRNSRRTFATSSSTTARSAWRALSCSCPALAWKPAAPKAT